MHTKIPTSNHPPKLRQRVHWQSMASLLMLQGVNPQALTAVNELEIRKLNKIELPRSSGKIAIFNSSTFSATCSNWGQYFIQLLGGVLG